MRHAAVVGVLLVMAVGVVVPAVRAEDEQPLSKIAEELGLDVDVATTLQCGKSEYRDIAKWLGAVGGAVACIKFVCTPVLAGEAATLFATLGIPTAVCATACAVAGGLILAHLADAVLPLKRCASAIVNDTEGATTWAHGRTSAAAAVADALRHHQKTYGRSGRLIGTFDRLDERCQVAIRADDPFGVGLFVGAGSDATAAAVSAFKHCQTVQGQSCSKNSVIFSECNQWN